MQIEYYPKGPSDSSAVRALAQSRYASLLSSSASNDRNKFIKWALELTKELLEIQPKPEQRESLVKQQPISSYRISTKETFDFDLPLTEEMKVASLTSLERIRRQREKLMYHVLSDNREIEERENLNSRDSAENFRNTSDEENSENQPFRQEILTLKKEESNFHPMKTISLEESVYNADKPIKSDDLSYFAPKKSSEEPVFPGDIADGLSSKDGLDLSGGRWKISDSGQRSGSGLSVVSTKESVDLSALTSEKVNAIIQLSGGGGTRPDQNL